MIRVAVVGCGAIADAFHLPALRRGSMGDASLILVDPDSAGALRSGVPRMSLDDAPLPQPNSMRSRASALATVFLKWLPEAAISRFQEPIMCVCKGSRRARSLAIDSALEWLGLLPIDSVAGGVRSSAICALQKGVVSRRGR